MPDTNPVARLLEKFKQVNYWLLILPMIALVGMFFIDAVNVTTIRLFHVRATPAQKEMIEELTVVVAYMALAYILIGPGHIKTDMVKNRFGPRLRFVADVIGDTATLAVAGFCTWTMTGTLLHTIAFRTAKQGEVSFPLAPIYVMMTLSFLLLAVAALLVMINHILCFRESCRAGLEPEKPALPGF